MITTWQQWLNIISPLYFLWPTLVIFHNHRSCSMSIRWLARTLMTTLILQDFSTDDVYNALMQMFPWKVQVLMEWRPNFFRSIGTLWVQMSLMLCLNSIHTGNILKRINYTHVTLVPKVTNPESLTQFRPISIYNIVSKMLTNICLNGFSPNYLWVSKCFCPR